MVERDVGHTPLPPQQVHALPVDVVGIDRLARAPHRMQNACAYAGMCMAHAWRVLCPWAHMGKEESGHGGLAARWVGAGVVSGWGVSGRGGVPARLLALEHVQPPMLGGLGGVGRLAILEVDAVDLPRQGEAAGEGCSMRGGCVA